MTVLAMPCLEMSSNLLPKKVAHWQRGTEAHRARLARTKVANISMDPGDPHPPAMNVIWY